MRRGVYLCAGYKTDPHEVRAKDTFVDHIEPVVDPEKGFEGWDTYIERLFVERDGLQVLCRECHSLKTKEERARRNGKK